MTRSPNSAPVPLHGEACEAFAQGAVLRVDRELGRAEQARLDAHLASCPHCRDRAREAELVSRALKHWDAERGSTVHAPARLRQSVRSMVKDEGARRRREYRYVRGNAFAMAAAILLAIGAGVFFGWPALPPDAQADISLAAIGAPRPSFAAVEVPPSATPAPLDVASSTDTPWQQLGVAGMPAVRWIPTDELAEVAQAVRYLGLENAERDFFANTGETGIRWEMPDGRSGLVSAGALACIRARGEASVESYLAALSERTGAVPEAGHVYGTEPVAIVSNRGIADVLPLRGDRDSVESFLQQGDVSIGGKRLRLHAIAGSPAPVASDLVFDLERAHRLNRGRVTLAEAGGTDLVLIAKGMRHPIFIPAGELIQGGRVDRVVARNVWIPAVVGEERFELPCMAVGTESDDARGGPRPTGLMAGPGLRRLLADGASAEKVSVFVDGLVRARSLDFSLLSRLRMPEMRQVKQQLATMIRERNWRGFGVTDAEGRLAGIELSGLGAEASADLLARVALGYELEDALRRSAPAEAQAAGGAVVPARVTLMELLEFDGRLRLPDGERGTHRRATIRDARSGMTVEVFERAPGGAVIFASALGGAAE